MTNKGKQGGAKEGRGIETEMSEYFMPDGRAVEDEIRTRMIDIGMGQVGET